MSANTYHQTIDYAFANRLSDDLVELAKQLVDIASEWNGDDAGALEDRAQIASELLDKIQGIPTLLGELL